ncbi:MAG: universal stress protein [Mycobacterium sp.]|nr:universal stress protein [Mycobacterium sp.]
MSGAKIIVGIDGSAQAGRAALWAIDEAVSRNATLRLIYVVRTDLSGTLMAAEYVTAVATAKHALGAARERIAERDSAVTVGTKIAHGSPAGVLLAESGDAEMVCLGWSGMNRMAAALMGSTATSVAAGATCPVAIVRTPSDAGTGEAPPKWVIVPVGASSRDDGSAIAEAVTESRHRGWPVLAVWTDSGNDESRVDAVNQLTSRCRQRFPDVHIYPVATSSGLAEFLGTSEELGGVVIIDGDSAPDVPAAVNRIGHATPAELAVVVAHTGSGRPATPAAARTRVTHGPGVSS